MPENPPQTEVSTSPRVFISYTHESEELVKRVLELSNRLRADGIVCIEDPYQVPPFGGWSRWTEEQITDADFVLMVCTETYYLHVTGREKPRLAKSFWGGDLIQAQLSKEQTRKKFIPVMLQPGQEHVPGPLRSYFCYQADTEAGYEELYRFLTNQPKEILLRKRLPLELKEQKQDLIDTELTVNSLEQFVLTNEARQILHRARVLATFAGKTKQEPRVTTSCLLFAISEGGRGPSNFFRTPQFLIKELQGPGYLDALRNWFPKIRYSSTGGTIDFDTPEVATLITPNVLRVFQRAAEISKTTLPEPAKQPIRNTDFVEEELLPGHVSARHLLAALLVLEETGALFRLGNLVSVEQLRQKFLTFVSQALPGDDHEAWGQILVPTKKRKATKAAKRTKGATKPAKTATEVATPAPQVAEDFRHPLAGFLTDYWQGEDLLNIQNDVNALASLVAAYRVEPPLSIGLFGDWGSGKTHFMRQMRARVEELSLAAAASPADQSELGYFKHIVQIEFNAWHYIEGNLWASLVEHIFENLRLPEKKGNGKPGTDEVGDARLAVMEQIGVKKELQAKVAEHQKQLKTKQKEAETRASDARSKKSEASEGLILLRDQLDSTLMNQLKAPADFSPGEKELLTRLGLPSVALVSPAEIHKSYQEAKSLWHRILGGWNLIRTDPQILKKYALALVLLVVPIVVGFLLKTLFASVYAYLGSVFSLVLTAWAATKPYREKVQEGVAALKDKYDQIEQARQQRIVELDNEVNVLTREYKEAECQAEAINKEVENLETQLNGTTVNKLLAGFIEDRAACSDYRRHLGVLALIRRDFERLSNFLGEQRRVQREGGTLESEKTINRIILYIDDLDRCPPERVVQVLQAIHLLLAFPLFIVVVGVDARWVTRSLQESYEWLQADEDDEQETSAGQKESTETPLATPHDYLEKIFQIPFWLKSMEDADCKNLLEGLTKDSRSNGSGVVSTAETKLKTEGKQSDDQSQLPKLDESPSKSLTDTVDPTQAEFPSQAKTILPAAAEATVTTSPVQTVSAEARAPIDEKDGSPSSPADEKKSDATSAPEEIDLSPQNLTLTDPEIEYMKELTQLVGRSPRAVKRFLNCYRLIKVGLQPSQMDAFLGSGGKGRKDGDFRAAMLLLSIITGAPSVSLHLIEELETSKRKGTSELFHTFLERLGKSPEVSTKRDWPRVREFLDQHVTRKDSAAMLTAMCRVMPRVSRYSFKVSRIDARPVKTPRARTGNSLTRSGAQKKST